MGTHLGWAGHLPRQAILSPSNPFITICTPQNWDPAQFGRLELLPNGLRYSKHLYTGMFAKIISQTALLDIVDAWCWLVGVGGQDCLAKPRKAYALCV